jgi:uncharacterized membrane protein YeaQ/YmgE (transglycosylase-associated protein family)
MYSVWICILIGVVIGCMVKDWGEKRAGMMCMGLLGAFVGVFVMIIFTLSSPKKCESVDIPLVAFRDGTNISGNFFLGCGIVEQNDAYFYYTQRQDGGIKRGRVVSRCDNVTIYEQDRKNGILRISKMVGDRSWKWINWTDKRFAFDEQYVFYVPKGTVVRQFVANLGEH